jgi:iron(II)-dependent oxidoreductase
MSILSAYSTRTFLTTACILASASLCFAEPPADRVAIEADEFVMGSTYCEDQQGGSDWCADEVPHRVRLDGFFIAVYEVTNEDYQECFAAGKCGPNMLHEDRPKEFDEPRQPVVFVTHQDAVDYCRFKGGRLPTEAEWERAAQAENLGGAHFGKPYNQGAPRNVGEFHASSRGLHDMMGNVYEWTGDWFGPLVTEGVQVNPQGPDTGKEKVVRGGSWNSPNHYLRPADRVGKSPELRYSDVGFRCVWPHS